MNHYKTIQKYFLLIGMMAMATWATPAPCNGDTIFLRAPANWIQEWYVAAGVFTQIPASDLQSNGWYKFTLSLDSANDTTFQFSNLNTFYPSSWIGKNVNYSGAIPLNGYNSVYTSPKAFSCSDFGNATSLYIYENPDSAGKTAYSSTLPSIKIFYFIAPDSALWLQGSALMIMNGTDTIHLAKDTTRCGYYRATYFNRDLDSTADFVSDLNPSAAKVTVNIKQLFANASNPDTLYYNPSVNSGASTTDPQAKRQCSLTLATLIYDTDASLNGAFSCDNYPMPGTSCPSSHTYYYPVTDSIPCLGVTLGIVQPALGSDHLPHYNSSSVCFSDSNSFNQLYHPVAQVNKQVCSQLSLQKNSYGYWEYNSLREPSQAFYPIDDQSNDSLQPGFQRIGNGGIKEGTGAGTLATDDVNPLAAKMFASNVNWANTDSMGLTNFDFYPTMQGEFASGSYPNVYDVTEWGTRTQGKHNTHFCVETHATFTQSPGRFLAINATNDSWVYLNNKLVVDLGGLHLAAPGLVFLDSVAGLVNGQDYPLDLFVCNRRTTMSDLHIKTNLLLQQRNPLYYTQSGSTFQINKIQSSTDCGARVTVNDSTGIVAGTNLPLQFYVLNNNGDTIPPDSIAGLSTQSGSFTIDPASLATLASEGYQLLVVETDSTKNQLKINFSSLSTTTVINRSANMRTNSSAYAMVPMLNGIVRIPAQLQNQGLRVTDINGRTLAQAHAHTSSIQLNQSPAGMVLLIAQ